jgi:RHS repeat-associated protein
LIDNLTLTHMNGRVHDQTIGRFVSADPFVQAPHYSQSLNRYAYVWNNPLALTDPSGFDASVDDVMRCVRECPVAGGSPGDAYFFIYGVRLVGGSNTSEQPEITPREPDPDKKSPSSQRIPPDRITDAGIPMPAESDEDSWKRDARRFTNQQQVRILAAINAATSGVTQRWYDTEKAAALAIHNTDIGKISKVYDIEIGVQFYRSPIDPTRVYAGTAVTDFLNYDVNPASGSQPPWLYLPYGGWLHTHARGRGSSQNSFSDFDFSWTRGLGGGVNAYLSAPNGRLYFFDRDRWFSSRTRRGQEKDFVSDITDER